MNEQQCVFDILLNNEAFIVVEPLSDAVKKGGNGDAVPRCDDTQEQF